MGNRTKALLTVLASGITIFVFITGIVSLPDLFERGDKPQALEPPAGQWLVRGLCDEGRPGAGATEVTCTIENLRSEILTDEVFATPGSFLRWRCSSSCAVVRTHAIDAGADGELRFDYLNPGETARLVLRCWGEANCQIEGRARGSSEAVKRTSAAFDQAVERARASNRPWWQIW